LPENYEKLLFLTGTDQEPLFGNSYKELTTEAANVVIGLYQALLQRKAAAPDTLRSFLLQIVWCLFAEDLGMLLVVGLTAQLERAHARIAELEARLERDSTNSSAPPSQDSIAAKAKRRADRSSRERSKDRKPGGQPGRKGSGLVPTVTPDRTETPPPPNDCSGCGGDLADAADAG
jgi:hypothetical protein